MDNEKKIIDEAELSENEEITAEMLENLTNNKGSDE